MRLGPGLVWFGLVWISGSDTATTLVAMRISHESSSGQKRWKTGTLLVPTAADAPSPFIKPLESW